jgi:Domain of unknown function (DUF4394)
LTGTIRIRSALALCAGVALLATAPVYAGGDGGKKSGDWKKGMKGCLDKRSDDRVMGLTSDARLVCFDEDSPESAQTLGTISGLVTDTKIVGIDFRPASGNDGDSGDLYALGNSGGVYVLDNAAKGTLKSRLNVALAGTSFGVDFNPVVDRLRVVSDTGQNLRVNVDTGETIVDGPLTNPAVAPATGTVPATGVTGAAYTNNDADPNTATTLFVLDTTLDQLAIQSPANAGSLASTGKLGVDAGLDVGLDIYSKVRGGSTVKLTGLASLSVAGASRFYRVDLLTGRVSDRGAFASGTMVTDIAAPLNQR